MKEIDAQSLIVQAVCDKGGYAHKLSNRFLIGVADLLVKLPDAPAALIEVKLEDINRREGSFKLKPTVLQRKFLQSYQDAGMRAGMASFIERGKRGVRGLLFACYRLDRLVTDDFNVRIEDHALLIDHGTRYTQITFALRQMIK